MTEITKAKYHAIWVMLHNLNQESGRGRTAGEIGKAVGMHRNTAKKYLDELIGTNTVRAEKTFGINNQTWTYYWAIKPGELK